MEVPACKRCNSGNSELDQLAAFCAMSQHLEPEADWPDTKIKDFRKVAQGCLRNIPDMLDMFKLGPNNGLPVRAIIFDDQKLFKDKLNAWAAKQALAHWFKITNGRIFPSEGMVAVRWITNGEFGPQLNGFAELLTKLSNVTTLTQGKWNVSDQFFVRWEVNAEDNIGGIYCRYHGTGFLAALVEDETILSGDLKLLSHTDFWGEHEDFNTKAYKLMMF